MHTKATFVAVMFFILPIAQLMLNIENKPKSGKLRIARYESMSKVNHTPATIQVSFSFFATHPCQQIKLAPKNAHNFQKINPGYMNFRKFCAFFGASLICWQGWVAK